MARIAESEGGRSGFATTAGQQAPYERLRIDGQGWWGSARRTPTAISMEISVDAAALLAHLKIAEAVPLSGKEDRNR